MYLYQLLQEKPYPLHQYMDEESIKWLKDHLNPIESNITDIIPDYHKMPIGKLDIDILAYQNNGFGIHGFRHQLRVCIYIWLLVNLLKIDIDVTDLLEASLYHDICRVNDNKDEEHGQRSALWIKRKYVDISDNIINAVKYHDANIEGDIYLTLLKTADALDRYRLPKEKWWLDKKYLKVELNDNFIEHIKYLTYSIENIGYKIDNINDMKKEIFRWLKEKEII